MGKKNLNLCITIPSLQPGGMERVMTELLWYFSRKNITTHLILYGIKRDVFYQIPEQVKIYRPEFTFDNKKRFTHTLKTIFYLRKQVKKIKPDTILSFGEFWNNLVLLSTLGLSYPVYVSDRSQPDKSLGFFQDRLRRWLYPMAKGIILQSEKAKQNFLKNITERNKNIKVIGNPIRKIEKDKNRTKKKTVLMVGRLIKSKNQHRLIEIFASINMPDWKLVLVGFDDLKQNNMEPLKELSNSLGIGNSVFFAGKQTDVDSYYEKSGIFAFTSSSEGFPNVIGEAMSAGLPVIAYDCIAGPSEMIIDGVNGYLIPLFDDLMFKEKLFQLMEDEDLRNTMGRKASETIKMFDVEIIGEKFYQFIFNNI